MKRTEKEKHQDSGLFTALDPVQPPLYPPYYTQTSGSLYLPPLFHTAPTMVHPSKYLPYSDVKPTKSGVPDRMLLKGSVDEVVHTSGEEKKEVDREETQTQFRQIKSRKEDLKLPEVRRNLMEDEARLSRLHEEMEIARKELKHLKLRAAEISTRMEKVGWNQDQFDKEDNSSVVSPLGGLKVQLSELRRSCRSSVDRHTESVKEEEAAGAPDEKMKRRSESDSLCDDDVQTSAEEKKEVDRDREEAADQRRQRQKDTKDSQGPKTLYLDRVTDLQTHRPESSRPHVILGLQAKWRHMMFRMDKKNLFEVRSNLMEAEFQLRGLHREIDSTRMELKQLKLWAGIRIEEPGWNQDQFDKEDNECLVPLLGGLKVQFSPLSAPWRSILFSESTQTSCRSSADRHTESVKEEEAAGAPDEKMKRRSESELLSEVRVNLMVINDQLTSLRRRVASLRKELNPHLSILNRYSAKYQELLRKEKEPGWKHAKTHRKRSQAGYVDTDHDICTMSELMSSISCSTPPPDSQTESVKEEEAAGAPDEKMKRSSESDSLYEETLLDLSSPPHWIQEGCVPQSLGMNIMHDDDDEDDADDVQTSAEEKKEVDRDREEAADPAQETASEQPAEGAPHSRDRPLMMSQHVSASSAQPPKSDPQTSTTESCSRPRSASWSSPSQPGSDRTLRRAASLSDMKSESSLEEFTPEFWEDGDDEVYSFHCSCPGLFRCSVTGLVFHMQGGGDVFYRLVPWDRSLLAPHHKKPAGPLFDIQCPQQCVSQLHLPHCEIRSTGGCGFLSVVHLKGDGVEFIPPHRVTDTHVIINITGFSAYGNVKDEDSPPDPVQALVLLFYRPPEDPDLTSFLSVLLLPRNIVIRDIQRTRKKLVGKERFIETSPHCKLQPKQLYTLSTDPEDDLILVQPMEAEFDEDYNNNYFPVFQVILEKIFKHIKLLLKDSESSHSVWERRVYLQSTGVTRSSGSTGLRPHERLRDVRSSFIEKISAPVLSSLLDKLLEKKVLTDAERESAEEKPNRRDRAGSVIDTVRRKGEAASSELIHFLCEVDPFLCEHLGLS
ncbi:uncharacterized protein LOC114452832 [Parambassis ranga]|uniref:Uncharacterized protein LOC114452832 n=1 Tax=Parambassis ranga TaxID=210632 RepID=A0A6P7KEP0_9TELE|nr:uncharacterized protein LOC114452832 [Parambassis ranga]